MPTTSPAKDSYAPWPTAFHDARHSSSSPIAGPTTGRVAWRKRLEGPVVPGPVVGTGGVTYVASNAGVLHALRVSDGRELWRFDGGAGYGIDLSTSPTVLPDGSILWPGPGGLYGLSRAGRRLWKLSFDSLVLSPLLASRGRIYVQEMDGQLHALRLRGRSRPRAVWSNDLGTTSYGSPALGPSGDVYATVDNQLAAVRSASGRVRWRFAARGIVEVSPAVAPDGTIVLGTNDRFEYGVRADGRERWRYPRGDLTYSSPGITADGTAYFGDHRGFLNAVDVKSGDLVARYRGQGRTRDEGNVGIWTAPLVDARRNVYFGTHPGKVFGFARDARRLFAIAAGGVVDSYPALAADGTLLIGSESGELIAIRD
ncbi:MAG: PQQ-binding-like beta-propeller repeat protein [Thermoleophilaceae bacterium]